MSRKLDSPVQTQMAVAILSSPLGGGDYGRGQRMEAREHAGRRSLWVQTENGSNQMEGEQSVGIGTFLVQPETGNHKLEVMQSAGRRRVFVQTDTGCVLGMELDRGDNAHTVKRRLQLALNFPTDQTMLSFGDIVLKNDLSAVRNDTPLLLSRNLMHRSSSTPCLSPTGRDIQQRDWSGPIEILGQSNHCSKMKHLVKSIGKAMKMGIEPLPIHCGLGGSYYFRNCKGESVAIVKPTDEEPFAPNNPKGFVGKALGQPGLKRSVRVGETGFREVAAYLLDHQHFANVPPTSLVKITHSIFNVNDGVNGNKPQRKKLVSKIASLQQFIPHDFDASDHGTSSFPVSAVHRIGILDIRILNTDRHGGNLLVRKLDDGVGRFGEMELFPIDHGLCLPEILEDPYFEWIHWPQASIPFSEDELDYIESLDPLHECEMLRMELPMIREACLRVLIICTIFLKEAAAFGLCLAEIGEMMSREFCGGEEEPSELELLCIEARKMIADREELSPKTDLGDDEFQFDIDCEEPVSLLSPRTIMDGSTSSFVGIGNGNGRCPLSKLEETIEEEEEEEESKDEDEDTVVDADGFGVVDADGFGVVDADGFGSMFAHGRIPTMSKLSSSLSDATVSEKIPKFHSNSGAKIENGYSANASSGHRSANEQLPASISFVKLADMNEGEWTTFVEKFQELLYPTFAKRKSVTLGKRQRQRLGTSCQF